MESNKYISSEVTGEETLSQGHQQNVRKRQGIVLCFFKKNLIVFSGCHVINSII